MGLLKNKWMNDSYINYIKSISDVNTKNVLIKKYHMINNELFSSLLISSLEKLENNEYLLDFQNKLVEFLKINDLETFTNNF